MNDLILFPSENCTVPFSVLHSDQTLDHLCISVNLKRQDVIAGSADMFPTPLSSHCYPLKASIDVWPGWKEMVLRYSHPHNPARQKKRLAEAWWKKSLKKGWRENKNVNFWGGKAPQDLVWGRRLILLTSKLKCSV